MSDRQYYAWLASAANAAQVPLKEAFEAGYLAGKAAQREIDAGICDAIEDDKHRAYKGIDPHPKHGPHRADPHTDGMSDGAATCAAAIREQT